MRFKLVFIWKIYWLKFSSLNCNSTFYWFNCIGKQQIFLFRRETAALKESESESSWTKKLKKSKSYLSSISIISMQISFNIYINGDIFFVQMLFKYLFYLWCKNEKYFFGIRDFLCLNVYNHICIDHYYI